jgi:hypothetical protein
VRDERVLWGVCDPLPTPRPLGPIHDIAHRLAPASRDVLDHSAAPYDIFAHTSSAGASMTLSRSTIMANQAIRRNLATVGYVVVDPDR